MKYPKLKFRAADPLQDYYSDRNGDLYSVARIIDETKDLKHFDMPIAGLDLAGQPWDGCNIYALGFHCKKVKKADLNLPIILDWNGSIADGRHRIIKALMLGKKTIKAVRLLHKMNPCKKAD